jgi:hypothetical protein
MQSIKQRWSRSAPLNHQSNKKKGSFMTNHKTTKKKGHIVLCGFYSAEEFAEWLTGEKVTPDEQIKLNAMTVHSALEARAIMHQKEKQIGGEKCKIIRMGWEREQDKKRTLRVDELLPKPKV